MTHDNDRVSRAEVKPLVWRPYRNGDAYAITAFGVVYAAYAGGRWRTNLAQKFRQAGSDIDAAKAAAQADYESRIRSALTTEAGDGWASRTEDMRAAYLAGFNASSSEHNGHYPFTAHGRDPEQDAMWMQERDAELARLDLRRARATLRKLKGEE